MKTRMGAERGIMSDVDCPYCGKEQEICYDDGHGREEEKLYEQECADCGKNFIFYTEIIFVHEPRQADCLNGAEHSYKPCFVTSYPDAKRCEWCGHTEYGKRVQFVL